jgi:hypothetical protein
MKKPLYAIYDSAIEAYLPPFIAQAEGAALRDFGNLINTPGTPAYDHPGDYHLFRVGHFQDGSGMLEPEKTPHRIASGLEVKTQTKPQEV